MKQTIRFLPLALAACAALFPSGQALADYPSTVLSYGPVAYWRFNETAASPAPSTVADSSGNGLSGYPLLGTTLGTPGVVGNAALLSNPGLVVGNCITRIDIPNSRIVDRNAPFTVEFWMNPSAINADATGLCPVSSFTPYYYGSDRSGWLFYVNSSGKVNFRLGGENSYIPGGNISSGAGSVVAGTWTHVVGTYDGASAQLFINGALAASAATGAGFNPNLWSVMRIGGTPLPGSVDTYQGATSGNRGWDGGVDEVAVYSNILSAATVAAHYAAATTNNAGYHAQILADGPVGYWELEEPAYTDPSTNTYPLFGNAGSAATDATGVLSLGALADQAGSGYAGLGSGNNSVFFDGESGSLTMVTTNNPSELTFAGTPITLLAWIKPTEIGGWRSIIAQGWDPATGLENYLRISNPVDWEGQGTPDIAYYELGAYNGTTYASALSPVPAGDVGNWVFLAGTWDGSFWNLYRNGVLVAQTPDEIGPVAVGDAFTWTVGSRSSPDLYWGWNFSGWIDEPAILNTALNADQIQALYTAAQVPPVLTVVPVSPGTVYVGSSVTFTSLAEGNPTLAYQWKKGSTPLTGETNPTLTVNNVAVSDSGTYSVVVTNAYGSATASVTLTVIPGPPSVIVPPVSETRWAGFPFEFSVTAGGTAPLGYQWSLNNTPIPGATSATYSGTASAADAGTYLCVVTNSVGSASASAVLTVLAQSSGYVSAVLGDGPIAYWRLNETSGTVAHDYVGGNDGRFNNVEIDQPSYNVFDPNTLAVKFNGVAESDIVDIPGTNVNFTGASAEFSIEAWVNGPSAQQVAGSAIIVKGTGSNGGTANEQFELGLTSANQYTVFSRGGANTSYGATASVGPDGTWQHVVGVYDSANQAISIYVNGELSGTPSATLVPGGVHLSSSPISIGAERSGTTPTWDLAFTGFISDVAVYPVALNPAQVLTHYQATYGTNTAPHITLQPLSVTNYVGLPASFTVGALGSVPLAYQWKKNNAPISGANGQSYSIPSLALGDAGNYTVTITNGAGTSNSVVATLTVLAAPTTPPAIEGLVLHLPFDNNLTDASGRGNSATNLTKGSPVSGTVGFVPGVLGQAFAYETDVSNGDFTNSYYATLGLRPDLQFSSNVSFTVSYWIQLPPAYTLGDLPFLTDTVGSTFGTGLVLAPTYGTDATQGAGTINGGWAMSVIDHGGNGLGVYGEVGTLNDGNWHSLVQVFDRTGGFTCYLDGQVVGFTVEGGTGASETAAGDIDTGAPFNIGQDPTGLYPENGSAYIDDLAIWRKALTPLEAASIYVAGLNSVPVGNTSFISPLVVTKLSGGELQFTWSAGTLQSAPSATGPYTDVGAKSPYTVSDTTGNRFFRTKL